LQAGGLSAKAVVCWGRRSPLVGEGDRADVGGKRESSRADTVPGEDRLSRAASRDWEGEAAPRIRGGEALIRRAATSAGNWGSLLREEPGGLSWGVGDGPRLVDAAEGSGECRRAIASAACWRARLASVWWGALGVRVDEGGAGARRGAVRWRSGSRELAARVAARPGDVGSGVEWFGRVGLGAVGLEAGL